MFDEREFVQAASEHPLIKSTRDESDIFVIDENVTNMALQGDVSTAKDKLVETSDDQMVGTLHIFEDNDSTLEDSLESKLSCPVPGERVVAIIGGYEVILKNVIPLTKRRTSLWTSDVEALLPNLAIYIPMSAMVEPQGTMVVGMCYVSTGKGETPMKICLGVWLSQCRHIFVIVYDTVTEEVTFIKHASQEFDEVKVSHPDIQLPIDRGKLIDIYIDFCKTGKQKVMQMTGKMSSYKEFTSDQRSSSILWVPYKDEELPGLFDLENILESYNRVYYLNKTIFSIGDPVLIKGKFMLICF